MDSVENAMVHYDISDQHDLTHLCNGHVLKLGSSGANYKMQAKNVAGILKSRFQLVIKRFFIEDVFKSECVY